MKHMNSVIACLVGLAAKDTMKNMFKKNSAGVKTESDSFSESLSPVNRVYPLLFRLRDKICCMGLLLTAAMFMRFFLAK